VHPAVVSDEQVALVEVGMQQSRSAELAKVQGVQRLRVSAAELRLRAPAHHVELLVDAGCVRPRARREYFAQAGHRVEHGVHVRRFR